MMRRIFGGRAKAKDEYEYSIINPVQPPSDKQEHISPTRPHLRFDIGAFGRYIFDKPDINAIGSEGHDPRADHILNGTLEVLIPSGLGPRRCKRIRVGMVGTALLDFGFGTGGPQRYTVMESWTTLEDEGTSDGIMLYPGLQKFAWTIIIRSVWPPSDWHANAALGYDLYADLEGYGNEPLVLPIMEPLLPMSVIQKHQLPASSSPVNPWSNEGYSNIIFELSGHRIKLKHPERFPPYPGGGEGEVAGQEKLMGRYSVSRAVYLVQNPHRDADEEVPTLSERMPGFVDGLGLWELTLTSEAFTVAGYVLGRLCVTAPSPKLTIWSFRLTLIQAHTITSPDPSQGLLPQSSTETFEIFSLGATSPAVNRDKALWRGQEAGGKDRLDVEIHGEGRLPNDRKLRPSSVPGINGPIDVSHRWGISFTFSIYGEDEEGKPLPTPGPGVARTMRMKKPVMVPSCNITREMRSLPSYDEDRNNAPDIPDPCPLCQTPIANQLCSTCPTFVFPHPRHDHPPKLVGRESGVCPVCSERIHPQGTPNQAQCACGIPLDRLEQAAKAARKRDEEASSERLIASMTKDDGTVKS